MEQPETQSQQAEAPASSQGIGDVLSQGLSGMSDGPDSQEVPAQTEVEQTEQQPEGNVTPDVPERTGFGELTIGEQKVAFKSKEDFEKFIEQNPLLKEGYMKAADYTQKTQALSKEVEQIRQYAGNLQKTFDGATPESVQTLGAAFKGFQMADERQAQIANAVFADLASIAKGIPPSGPLALRSSQQTEQAGTQQAEPYFEELNSLKTELAKLRYEQQERDRQTAEAAQQKEYQSAVSQVRSWIDEKTKGGVTVGDDEIKVMAMFAGKLDPVSGKEITLDEAYELALARLGRTQKMAVRKVFETAKDASRKAPIAPSTRPSTAKREPKTYADIFSSAV